MMKVGLVLEGGAMRGMFTAGVLDTFLENKIEVDGIIGVSAGALFGVNYFSNQKGRAIEYNKRYAKDPRYISLSSLLFTGNMVNKKFAFYKMSEKLYPFDNDTYLKNGKDFYAVVTNVETGKAEYKKLKDPLNQMEILRATSALPMASKFVDLGGKKYLDGGISDSIPINKFLSLGYDKIIVVLTQPIDFRQKPLSERVVSRLKKRFKNYPNLLGSLLNRYIKYNKTLDKIFKIEKEGKIFVIRPHDKININIVRKNKVKLQKAYDMGIEDTNKILSDLKKYLKHKKNEN